MIRKVTVAATVLLAVALTACSPASLTAPAPSNVSTIAANVAADALLAEVLAGPALQVAFPNATPGWVKLAACVNAGVADAAKAVAAAPAGSSVESDAVAVLISALNSYAASKTVGACK